jgi:hypothetical protein
MWLFAKVAEVTFTHLEATHLCFVPPAIQSHQVSWQIMKVGAFRVVGVVMNETVTI